MDYNLKDISTAHARALFSVGDTVTIKIYDKDDNDVTPDSPADRAGIQGGTTPTDFFNIFSGGDLIIAIDGRNTQTFSVLLSYLMQEKSPGDTVTFTILRDDQEIEVDLILGKRP